MWSGTGMNGGLFDPTGLSGTISVTYGVTSGACTVSLTGGILITPAPFAYAGPDTTVCGMSTTLHATQQQAPGSWLIPAGIAISDPLDASATITAQGPGSYTLHWKVGDSACWSMDAVVITFLLQGTDIMVYAGADQLLNETNETMVHGQASPGASLYWEVIHGNGHIQDPTAGSTLVTGLPEGDHLIRLTASFDPCGSNADTLLIRVLHFFIPQGFSPNGDGMNDRFEITGIENHPANRFTVFDRWGREVYAVQGYDNSWDGHSTNGTPLLEDTYFYVLNLNGERTYNGYIILKR